MKIRLALAASCLVLGGCVATPSGIGWGLNPALFNPNYHDYTPELNAQRAEADAQTNHSPDTVWCRQFYSQPVTMQQCQAAGLAQARQTYNDPAYLAQKKATEDRINHCVDSIIAQGYRQRYSGEVYELCATGRTHPVGAY
jgi:hypothetical protein